ncbi:uncharacterized protein LOC108740718 [Agrilus planipennis]|uniref:Uncharacterized protein LOC108740718 n=1 Tax=Agrilus planipennis TaxID=224129 RepID=A0A1W4XE91_AGRPL|nr:uncharacterized protein LOC108740718 [Agrilus planipennis]
MPLVVAMALSGLEADQWNDELREMYEQGAQLVHKSCHHDLLRRPSVSSPSASSVASSYQSSIESGISSLSPSSGSGEFVSPFISQPPLELTCIGLSHRARAVEDIEKELFRKSTPKGTADFSQRRYGGIQVTIKYRDRNVLELGDHIKNTRNFFDPAVIPKGVMSYFENRSQISRLSGAEPPNFRFHKCSYSECGFNEPHYF